MPLVASALRTALAAACVLAVAGCSGTGSGTGRDGVAITPGHRKTAPDLRGTTLVDRTAFSLAAERGHVVVVNYWASWCDPCREELPYLNRVASDFRAAGVTFIGIDFHSDPQANARAFLVTHKVPYDSLWDPDSHTVLLLRGKVSVSAPPLTMVIDKQGRIAGVIDGQVEYTQLRALVAAAAAEPA